MKNIICILALLVVACNKIEPIEIVAPERDIDTQTLKQYKSQLQSRLITMGMLYNWGQESGAFLKSTPDSLDVIILKNSYLQMNDILKNDLKFVQEKKATKVLVGIELETLYQEYEAEKEQKITTSKAEKEQEWKLTNERLSADEKKEILQQIEQTITNNLIKEAKEKLMQQATTVVQFAKNNGFDGVSIEFPQNLNEVYSAENLDNFLAEITKEAGKGKNLLLVIENPYGERGETTDVKPIDSANWIVYRQKGKALFKNFDEQAQKWASFRYLPSVDFGEEDLAEGFADTKIFAPGGRLPRTIDVINWNATNKGGVAYYHIEKNYHDIVGNVSFKTLRNAIGKIQLTK